MKGSAFSVMATSMMCSERASVAAVCSDEIRMVVLNTAFQSGTERLSLPRTTSRSNSCSAAARYAPVILARPSSARNVFRVFRVSCG